MAIFYIFVVLTILGFAVYALQIWAVRLTLKGQVIGNRSWVMGEKGYRLSSVTYSQSPVSPVSILKPLKGLDDNLFDNLASFCELDYPEYEIIFSLQDFNDPAYKVAKKIKEKYPLRDITIITERCNEGLNPKVNNLIPAYKVSKHELILISDSNVMVGRDYLKAIAAQFQDESVGLVSNVIRGVGGRTLGAVFENLHLNSFVIGSVCFLDRLLKMPCVVGKSMLMRKKDLEAIGGLRAVKDMLAEDYIIGKKMHDAGKRVVLSGYMVKNVNEYWGIKKFINRHTRWAKLRWNIGGIKYLPELMGNAVFMSFLPILLWEMSALTIIFAAAASSFKMLSDYCLGRIVQSRGDEYSNAEVNPLCCLLSPVKDIIIGLLWFLPLLSTTVIWRDNRYTIGKDSALFPCPEAGIWSWRYRVADAIKARFA